MYRRDSGHDMGLLELGPLGQTGARLDLDDLPLVGCRRRRPRRSTQSADDKGGLIDDDRRDGTYRQTDTQMRRRMAS